MAGGGWITKHIVRDLDEARHNSYEQFNYSPYMVANVAVRNWRFLYKLGISSATWFEGFGRYVNIRKNATFGWIPRRRSGLAYGAHVVRRFCKTRASCSYAGPTRPCGDTLHFFHRV